MSTERCVRVVQEITLQKLEPEFALKLKFSRNFKTKTKNLSGGSYHFTFQC